MRFPSIALICSISLVSIAPARGWHHETTHREINTAAFNTFLSVYSGTEKYARSNVDTTASFQGPAVTGAGKEFITETDTSYSMADWIRHGGFFADQPELWAAMRHFYDPLKASGVAYLTDTIPGDAVNPHVDALTLAMSAEGNAWSDGGVPAQYNWEWALTYYRRSMNSLTSSDEVNRDRNLAKSFRALGQVMHLVADMTQPAHVRNDSHPYAEPVEDTIRINEVINSANGPVDSRVTIDGLSITQLFDSISRYTNKYFFSSDTIYDAATNVNPRNGEIPYPSPQLSDTALMTYNPSNRAYYSTFNGTQVPMVQMLLSYYIVNKTLVEFDTNEWHVPPSFAPHQAAVLIPIAVKANAEVINRFLPTLDATLTVSATSAGEATIDGALTHNIDKDPEWKTRDMQIFYNGPAALMLKEGGKIADLTFRDGAIVTTSVSLAAGNVVYLEIRAGGRIITSEEHTFSPANVTETSITNGNFESGYPGSDPYVEVESDTIPGWQLAASQWAAPGDKVYWRGPGTAWQQIEGSYHVYLGYLGLQTTFTAIPEKTYSIQFYMTGIPGNAKVALDVTFGNLEVGLQKKSFEMSTVGRTVANLGWVPQSCTFAMPAASGPKVVMLSFTGGVGGPTIDAVTVE